MNTATVRVIVIGLFLFTALAGCATVDDYLEVSLDKEPKVIFSSDVQKSSSDTLLILAVNDASIMKRMKIIKLGCYLENTSGTTIQDVRRGVKTKYLQFSQLPFEGNDTLFREYSRLRGKDIFTLLLRGMTVDGDHLSSFKTLGDGEFRFVTTRNAALAEGREIQFIVKEIGVDTNSAYRDLSDAIYKVD